MKPRVLLTWMAALSATALSFIVHLILRFETVRLGYTLGKAREQEEKLLAQRRLLSLEAATLRQPDRVEAIARGSFGMEMPPPARVILVGNATHGSGRAP